MSAELKAYALLCLVLAFIGIWFAGDYHGHHDQAKTDQLAINKQQQEAADVLQKATDDARAKEQKAADLKDQLEKEHADHQADTDSYHHQLASQRLRFAAEPGQGCTGSASPDPGSAVPTVAPATVELSEEASSALRGIAYDADKLRDDYAVCYDWAMSRCGTAKLSQ